MIYERARCPSCGTFPDEWITARDEKGEVADPSGEPFVIPPPFEADGNECGGCRERERFEKAVFPKFDSRPEGVHVVLKPTNRGEYMTEMFTGPSQLDIALAED